MHLITPLVCIAFCAAASAQSTSSTGTNAGFVKLDTDKDGFLSKAEASADKNLARVFDKADLNKDGKLDEDEYLKGLAINDREKAGQYAGDSAITAKVKAVFFAEKGLPSTAITVETYKGKVQLSGFVDNQQQVTKAGKLAKGVKGVNSVQNNLQVK